jgi:hypothetical protein
MVPDQYTELQLPLGQKYLLTSSWWAPEAEESLYFCRERPAMTAVPETSELSALAANGKNGERVMFWYDPSDNQDVYVNTWGEYVPVPVPTPTRTPTPRPGGTGTIIGKVKLQGRTNYAGVTVRASGVVATTDASGAYALSSVPVGTFNVTAEMPGYLKHQKSSVVLTPDAILLLPDVTLLGGDANNDCMVNIFDLVVVAWNYGSTPPSDPRADINGNNRVDIFDLVLVGKNLDQACPGAWTSPSAVRAQSLQPAHLRVLPADQQVDVDDIFTVTLELEDVSTLYGVDVQLAFDPEVLEVVDADPLVPGVQITRGTFPNPAGGQVAKETADNDAGTVWYAVALKNPAPAVSGSGRLCSITFRAKTLGYSALRIQSLTLSDPTATSLPVTGHGGAVRVGQWSTFDYLPVVAKPQNEQ